MAHLGDADAIAVVHTGGELDDGLGHHGGAARTAAVGAGVGDDLARTAALGAHRLEGAGAEHKGEIDLDGTAAPAARTGMSMLGRDGSHAVAAIAGLVAAVLHRASGAVFCLLGSKVDIHHDVRSDLGVESGTAAPPAARGVKREAAEGEPAVSARGAPAVGRGRRRGRAGEGIARTHGVVACALLLIGKHRVGLGDLLEALLRIGLFVHVGVELARLLLKRLLDLLGGCVLGDTKDGVVVFFVHRSHRGLPSSRACGVCISMHCSELAGQIPKEPIELISLEPTGVRGHQVELECGA